MLHRLETEIVLPQPPQELFPFFSDAGNLERITPPELRFSIEAQDCGPIGEDSRIRYRLRLWGVSFGWKTVISQWSPPRQFVDQQVAGPFRYWHHRHLLLPAGGGARMIDEVDYALPLSPIGELAHPLVRRQLRRIFTYRHHMMRRLFAPGAPEACQIRFYRAPGRAGSNSVPAVVREEMSE